MKMSFSLLKIPKIKKRVTFSLKSDLSCFVAGCSYFLKKDLDKVYSKQLRSYSPAKKKKYIMFFLSTT